jgi:hypothetical protein
MQTFRELTLWLRQEKKKERKGGPSPTAGILKI